MGTFLDNSGVGVFTVPGDLDPYMLSRGHTLYTPDTPGWTPQRAAMLRLGILTDLGTLPADVAAPTTLLVYRPEDFGAVGDGVADDTTAVTAAFTAANTARRVGVAPTILHPGATVLLKGKYNLATLAAPILVSANVVGSTAALVAPAAYAGAVLLVGHEISGSILQTADISLPDVVKEGVTSLTAGSVGVKVQNLYSSRLDFARTAYFETGILLTGLGNGTAYNEIHIGWVSYAKVSVKLAPGAGGWVNQNTFVSGGIQQSPGFDGGGYRRTGWKHLQLDGGGINGVNGNTFVGVSFEGDVSENMIDIRHASQSAFYGCRSEPGRAGRAVSTAAASSTVTLAAHGLGAGDMVVFAGTLPAELKVNVPYWVTSTPTSDTFAIAAAKGGTAITFAATTSSGLLYQPHRVRVDATTYATTEIKFSDTAAVLKTLEFVTSGVADGITQDTLSQRNIDANQDADRPLFRARNRNAAVTRALYAAYPPTVNPADDPNGWSAALSDRGLLFAESRAEAGRIFGSGGTIFYRVPADTASYEIASCRRSPSLIAVTALSCAANTTTNTILTLTGASLNDHVLVTPSDALPAGLVVSHARVTAANTVTVTFGNLTGSTISLTANLQLIAFRRFL